MVNAIDLHTHSTASDGLFSPTELLRLAHETDLRVLALTDHDTTEGLAEAATAAADQAIEFIPGIELSLDIDGSEIHMLGYYLEYERPAFQETLKILRDARIHRGERIVELLNKQGVHITWEHVREIAQGAVGRPHIAQALIDAGYVQSVPEAFEKYLGSHCPAYIPRRKLAPQDAIRLILSANGQPVLAHPLTVPGLTKLRQWLPDLVTAGLVGLETYYGPYTDDEVQLLHDLADEYKLIPTGGSDYHGPGIHPTPLGGRFVPFEAVERLKDAASKTLGTNPPEFILPPADPEP